MRLLVAAAAAALIVPAPALGWTWPVAGPVLIGFSFDPAHPYAAGQHRGIDIGAPAGAPVGAPASGTVSFAGSVPGGGRIVTIQTPDGYSVTLVHLGSFGVRRGAAVREGEPVGTVGPSGVPELDIPYVYLGIRRAGDEQGYLDPLLFLPASSPGAVEPPADGGEAVPPAPAPAPVPAAAPPAALAQSAPADVGPVPPARPRAPVHTTPHARGRSRALRAVSRDRGRPPRARTPLATRAVGVPLQTRRHAETPSRTNLRRGSRAQAHLPTPSRGRALPSTAGPARVVTPSASRGAPGGGLPLDMLAATLGLALLLGCAYALRRRLVRRRARGLLKAVRIIDSDALLPDDTDLLRERDASHRARVHDDCRGRAGSSPPTAGGRDLLPHRHRRARIQGLPRRGGAGARRQDVRRPHRRRALA
ncbi:MAG: M23 family metallopeptidase [Actinobacteria bacterium]|nr:MAG: M23 family metallopeptidase [Actinomycetota bacterium]